jgi:hypothetical protein
MPLVTPILSNSPPFVGPVVHLAAFAQTERSSGGRTYPAVAECVYCGETRYARDSPRSLATEHIIPDALNGRLLLPQASCRECERNINRAETFVLRGCLLACRAHLGLKFSSQNPKILPLFDCSITPNRASYGFCTGLPISPNVVGV